MKKNNEINQNYIALIEQAKEGFYYKSKFENKKFFEKSFLICRSNEEEIDDSDKDLNNEYYELNQGDLIKLGRMYIKIREICINGNIISKKSNDKQNIINRLNTSYEYNNNSNNNNNINKNKNKKNKLCRVCYSDEKEVDSPLISPCKCMGGLKYIHLSCLRNWISARAILKSNESNDECLKYEINQVNCEICQEPYPDYIYSQDKEHLYEIFDFIQMKFNNYIIIETIPINYNSEEIRKKREIFVLSFDEKDSIFIGRSHSTDMRLNDITVSRYHSKIIFNRDKNKYYIRDMGSKFGTGILIQNNKLKINNNFPLYIQISKCTILLSIQKTCNFFCSFFVNCCNSNEENKLYKYYGKENSNAIEIEKIFQFKQSNENEDIEEQDISNVESITEKTLKSKNSERVEEIKLPMYNKNNNINDDYEKLNINKNKNEITRNNTEATLMGTFISPDNTQNNKSISFIRLGKNNNNDIKFRIMKKIEKFSINSENIEEEPKEENNINNHSMNKNNNLNEIEESNNEDHSKHSKNSIKPKGRFKGKKGLEVSSLSFNRSIGGGDISNINENNENNIENIENNDDN